MTKTAVDRSLDADALRFTRNRPAGYGRRRRMRERERCAAGGHAIDFWVHGREQTPLIGGDVVQRLKDITGVGLTS